MGTLPRVTEHATEHTRVHASVERCFEVVTDFAHYPEWAGDIKETEVHRTDEQGRGVEVTFRAAAMGRSVTVRIEYDYSKAPYEVSWHLLEGDLARRYEGHYRFTPLEGEQDVTDLEYQLRVELVVPLPGFVKRRAETRIIKAALPDLKAYIETGRVPRA